MYKLKKPYKDFVEIFDQLVILGLHEAAYYLSIMLNKSIMIKLPEIKYMSLEEIVNLFLKEKEKHKTVLMNYRAETSGVKKDKANGLMLFVFSNNDIKNLTDIHPSLMDKLKKYSKEIADSILIETINIVGSSILKIFSNKSSIKFLSCTPQIYEEHWKDLRNIIDKNLTEKNIVVENALIIETAFMDEEKEVQLRLLLIPGDTYSILLNKLLK